MAIGFSTGSVALGDFNAALQVLNVQDKQIQFAFFYRMDKEYLKNHFI